METCVVLCGVSRMRKLVGVLVLLAGLGLAANVFRSSQDRIASLDQVLKSSNDSRSGSVARSQSARSAVGTVSPERRSAASPEPAASAAPAPTRWQRQEVVVNYDAAAGTSRDADGPAAPAPARDRLAVQNSAGQSSVAPGDAEARYQLARTLQAELRRVGCYEGDVDGSWGLGSKRAMAAFAKEVNAGLPTEEPDYILLKLVQAR